MVSFIFRANEDVEGDYPLWADEKIRRASAMKSKYPFATLEVGHSFLIPKNKQNCSFRSFQSLVSRRSALLGKKFWCRVHPEHGAFEVYRSE